MKPFLFLAFTASFLINCSTHKKIKSRYLISQTIPWMNNKEGHVGIETLYDSVYYYDTGAVGGIHCIQIQNVHTLIYNDAVKRLPAQWDFFLYEPNNIQGLYYDVYEKQFHKANVDSLTKYKIFRAPLMDTIRCLYNNPVEYKDSTNDTVCSFFHFNKSENEFDYDSIRLFYTSDSRLNTNLLSDKWRKRRAAFLYKIQFYCGSIYDSINHTPIPTRLAEVKISIDNSYNEKLLEQIIKEFKVQRSVAK